jgi:hypothetical protein
MVLQTGSHFRTDNRISSDQAKGTLFPKMPLFGTVAFLAGEPDSPTTRPGLGMLFAGYALFEQVAFSDGKSDSTPEAAGMPFPKMLLDIRAG